jgi:predicted Zn-dependent protease
MFLEQYDDARRYLEAALPVSEARYGPDHAETTGIRKILNDLSRMDNLPDYAPQAIGTKVVHWTDPATRPITVYIGDGTDVSGWKPEDKAIVRDAYAEWQQALNDRIRFEFTEDPDQADTLIGWMERPKPESRTTDEGEKQELALGECTNQFRGNQWLRDNIVLSVNDLQGKPLTSDSMHNVVLHEVAHSLGLVSGHSNHPSDVLYPNNKYEGGRRKKPTQRDINTIVRLYGLPPQITNPPGIRLVRFARFSDIYQVAGDAFNRKDYATALTGFQNALAVYPIAPDARFFAGISAYQLNRYDEAGNFLLPLASQSNDYQTKALRMAGYSLIKSAGAYEQSGLTVQAEQQYNQAYQLLSAGRGIAMDAENAKAVQDQLNWLSQRQALQSGLASADANGTRKPKKKSKWSWLFDQPPGIMMWVPNVPGMRY